MDVSAPVLRLELINSDIVVLHRFLDTEVLSTMGNAASQRQLILNTFAFILTHKQICVSNVFVNYTWLEMVRHFSRHLTVYLKVAYTEQLNAFKTV